MQALLLLATFSIQNVFSYDPSLTKYNDLKYRSYKEIVHPKIAIWNSKWQSKKLKMPFLYNKKYLSYMEPKKANDAKYSFYTAFPPVDPNDHNVNIPDSPMFPMDHHFQQRTRIKKVLPEYYSALSRVRRSVQEKSNLKKLDAKGPMPVVKAIPKAAAKPKENPYVKRNGNPAKKQGNPVRSNQAKSRRRKQLQGRPRKQPNVRQNQKRRNQNINKQKQSVRNNQKPKQVQKNVKALPKVKLPPAKKPNAASATKDARAVKKGTRRLIASRDADVDEFPYVVSIQKDGEHWCSGALLNPRLVITTANCVWKSSSLSRMRVRAGSRYTDHGGQRAKIQEVMKHPRWSIRSSPDNDIALLLLDHDLKFSDSIHGADLPNKVMMPPFGDAWVTSWGTERRDGQFKHQEKTLQKYHTRLMDHRKCANITKRYGVPVTENFICLSQDGHRAPCTRDTGAPAVSDGIVWGLASWSIRKLCGTENFPAMFSYLGSVSNMDFIMNATRYLMADERVDPFPDHLPRGYVPMMQDNSGVEVDIV